MPKDRLKKLKRYIKDGRPAKLKSFIKKHKLSLKDVEMSRGRNLLHYCCKHGSGVVLGLLLSEGVSAVKPDREGNVPLHVSLYRTLDTDLPQRKEVYSALVVPMLEEAPECLSARNYKRVSCRDLLEQLLRLLHPQENDQSDSSSDDVDFWAGKLEDEMAAEHDVIFGRYSNDNDFWGEPSQQTYDEWADRMASDHRHNVNSRNQYFKKQPMKTEKQSKKFIDEEKLKKKREELKRKYDFRQKTEAEQIKRGRTSLYERDFTQLSGLDSPLSFDDIPWPSKGSLADVVDVMFSGLTERTGVEFKKSLRRQQVRWHPDKFTQKFGKRLTEHSRSKIMERVKAISQELNRLSEKL